MIFPSHSHHYTTDKYPGPVYIGFQDYLLLCSYILCQNIFFIHFPASTHGVVVATGSPLMMVTAPFLQMGELLPEHPVTYTLEDMIPGPSPLISTAPEPPASASYHPSGISIPCSCASHSNTVPVRSANPAGNCHFK